MSQFNAFYQPGWNDILGPIQSYLDQQAAASQANSNQADQRAQAGGPIRRILGGLGSAIRGGLTNIMGNPQQRAANLGWSIPSGPIQGREVLPPRQQGNNRNSAGKWDEAALVWGNPQLGYYQPPDWAGWNNNPSLMGNPFNPMGSNYGGQPRPGAMRPPARDSLMKMGSF